MTSLVRRAFRDVRTCLARLNAFMNENLGGMSTVQLFGREARNFATFSHVNGQHRQANVDQVFYYAAFYPAIEVVSALSSALIIWYGGSQVLSGTLTLGALVAFLQYSQRFFRPISDLSEKFNVLQAAMAASERIFGVLDTEATILQPARAVTPTDRPAGRIEFEQVSDQPSVVRGAVGEFMASLGEAVAIVLAISFLTLGMRSGLVVALTIPLVLAATFLGMRFFGIDLHRISTGEHLAVDDHHVADLDAVFARIPNRFAQGLFVDLGQPFTQQRYLVPHDTTVGFYLAFARAPRADTATEP
mgnify:CR=1 FL=1